MLCIAAAHAAQWVIHTTSKVYWAQNIEVGAKEQSSDALTCSGASAYHQGNWLQPSRGYVRLSEYRFRSDTVPWCSVSVMSTHCWLFCCA